MSAPTLGTTTVNNFQPELDFHYLETFLATPQQNLIHSFGAMQKYAEAHMGKNTRMRRVDPLSTDGGLLDGSGIDPSPEVPNFADVDAETEIYAKVIRIQEQVNRANCLLSIAA